MEKDNLKDLFKKYNGQLDIHSLNIGHEARFINKLNQKDIANQASIQSKIKLWKPLLAIAASIVICLGIITRFNTINQVKDLASVSPELSETQDFFTITIANELRKLNQEQHPLTTKIINKALKQIEHLENDYDQLKITLTENGNDKRIIYAMISNFQSRIDILEIVLSEIETIKSENNLNNETTNTL